MKCAFTVAHKTNQQTCDNNSLHTMFANLYRHVRERQRQSGGIVAERCRRTPKADWDVLRRLIRICVSNNKELTHKTSKGKRTKRGSVGMEQTVITELFTDFSPYCHGCCLIHAAAGTQSYLGTVAHLKHSFFFFFLVGV